MKLRSFIATGLSRFSLSNAALLSATFIGGISTFVLVPGRDGYTGHAFTWGLVVLISQAAFAGLLLIGRQAFTQPRPMHVLLMLVGAGALRGLVVEAGLGMMRPGAVVAQDYLVRAINSSLISVIGLGLIGASLYWLDDYRRQYQLLSARSIALARSSTASSPVSEEALSTWRELKRTLDRSLEGAAEVLADAPSAETLQVAAQEILAAVDLHLRPSSKRLWPEALLDIRPLPFRALLSATVANWKVPIQAIVLFLAITVGSGSLVRSGVANGLAYTMRYLALTGLVLVLSRMFAERFPRLGRHIAVATLVMLPGILFMGDRLIGKGLLELPADDIAQLIVDIQTPVTVLLFALTAVAVQDRQHVLANLRTQIDVATNALLQQGELATVDLQQLSLFLHHSVQSELVATALQLQEAGLTNDLHTMDAARHVALARIEQLQLLDEATPPWLRDVSSYNRIDSIVQAWTGIARISLDIPTESAARADQWLIAAQVIEEGIANAIRHGDATSIAVHGVVDSGRLTLSLIDNGTRAAVAQSPASGLGLYWLESVAPGDWSLTRESDTSRLTVAIQ